MAEKKTVETKDTTPTKDIGLVPVFIPKERNDKPDAGEWVCVNGKPFLIKKGETVMVPKAVAEVINHSNTARDKAAEYKANAAKA